MKVLLLTSGSDWANLGYTFSRSLQTVGIDAIMLGKSPRAYGYPNRGISVGDISSHVESADIIQFMHSTYVETGIDLGDKRVFVFHGGGHYRDNPFEINRLFNPIVEKTLIQTGDLFGKGAKNEVLLSPAIDIGQIAPVFKSVNSNRLVIGHFPSSSEDKGSDIIAQAIKLVNYDKKFFGKFLYVTSESKVKWRENIERMSYCDIYIEQMKLGEWGISALEAAALGKVVITNFKSEVMYLKEYGNHELVIANNINELVFSIKKILSMDQWEILNKKNKTREWVEKVHNLSATGKRLKEVIYGI